MTKKIKVIKINPFTQTITEIEVENSFTGEEGMYKAMNCGTIEQLHLKAKDVLLLDENGTFKATQQVFLLDDSMVLWYRVSCWYQR